MSEKKWVSVASENIEGNFYPLPRNIEGAYDWERRGLRGVCEGFSMLLEKITSSRVKTRSLQPM